MDLTTVASQLAWPLAVAFAWVLGEVVHRFSGLPRISVYGLVGFVFGAGQLGLLSAPSGGAVMLLAHIGFGLILFEFGYRINLGWLRHNPWLAVTGVLEAVATFVAVTWLAQAAGMDGLGSLLLGSLAMSTSPASVMRVVNEQRSSGQVPERTLHLAALNCVLAVFVFKVIVGVWTFQSSGSVWQAVSNSLWLLAMSGLLGALFGVAVPGLLRQLGNLSRDATVAFALAVVLVVALAMAFKLSPVLAALTFGLVARHRRVAFSQTQRNFGALGDLLTVVLFVAVSSLLEWQRVLHGLWLGLALVGVRALVKVAATTALAKVSGITWRKGALTGLALTPQAVFVLLLLEQARVIGVDLLDQLAALAAASLVLEILGPIVLQRALVWARETPETTERR